jgi:hypothetical protein
MDNRYNGWTNYATWRVNLEVFDCFDLKDFEWHRMTRPDLAAMLREYVDEVIERTSEPGLARDYATAFISDVNWWEIAKHLMEAYADDYEDRGVLEQAAWHDTSAELL